VTCFFFFTSDYGCLTEHCLVRLTVEKTRLNLASKYFAGLWVSVYSFKQQFLERLFRWT